VRNPRREAGEADASSAPAKRSGGAKARGSGAPTMPTFKGIVVRAAIAAVVFYAYLLVVGSNGGAALVITLIAFAIMIPLGMLMARLIYRYQLKRWQKRQAGG
jgi:Flp pilus assembly protein TadB